MCATKRNIIDWFKRYKPHHKLLACSVVDGMDDQWIVLCQSLDVIGKGASHVVWRYIGSGEQPGCHDGQYCRDITEARAAFDRLATYYQ